MVRQNQGANMIKIAKGAEAPVAFNDNLNTIDHKTSDSSV